MAALPDTGPISEEPTENITLCDVLRQHGLTDLADRFSSGVAKCSLDDFLMMQQAELRQWTANLNELDDLVKAWRYACTTCSKRREQLQQSSTSDADSELLLPSSRNQCAALPTSSGESPVQRKRKSSLSFPRSMKTSGPRALREQDQSDQDSGVADTGDGIDEEPPSNLLASQKLGNSEPNIHSPVDTLSARTENLKLRRKCSLKRPRSMFVSNESVERGLASPESLSPQPTQQFIGRHLDRKGRRASLSSSMASSSGYNTSSSPAWSISSSRDGLHHLPSQPTHDDFQGLAAKLHGMSGSSEESPDEFRFRSRSRSLSPSRYPQPWFDMPQLNRIFRSNFPKAKIQMEENLKEFLDGANDQILTHQHADATISFVTKQLHELAGKLLVASQEGQLSNQCFRELTDNILQLYEEISNRRSTNDVTVSAVQQLVHHLLSIMSRPARLLECLDFDVDAFLNEVPGSQGDALEKLATLKSSNAVPRYIQSRLRQLEEGTDGLASRCMSPAISRSSSPVRDVIHSNSSFDSSAEAPLPTESSFETVKLISNGAYSSVHLVRHKESQKLFAMKKVSKINMIRKKQVEQVFCERDILTFAENPFVVSMICTFETKKHLCMVLEYVEGGDCATLLKNMQGAIPLELARLYFAETVLALEYIHNYGVVHRDLKPDNLLITSEGHIKLTDFGLSKIGLMSYATTMYESGLSKAQTFTDEQVYGTPDYIAPEVILRSGYGFPVDWWAMGIILYEFLVGVTPFFGDIVDELFDQITTDDVEPEFPDDFPLPEEAVDLIKGFLVRNPADRLGSLGTGADEVKKHLFFKPIHWKALLLQKAEFVPHLDNPEDTSYFDPRTDRYNHTLEGDEEIDGPLDLNLNDSFQGFASVSPRFMAINSPGNSRRTSSSDNAESACSESTSPSSYHSMAKSIHSRSLSSSSTASTFKGIAEGDEDNVTVPGTPELYIEPPTPIESPRRFCSPMASPVVSPTPSPIMGDQETRSTSRTQPMKPPDLKLQLPSDEKPDKKRVDRSYAIASPGASTASASLPSSPKPGIGGIQAAFLTMGSITQSVGSPRKTPSAVYTVERGPQGYGMELRAIRVYLGETDKYCVQHIVKEVAEGGAAWRAGVRNNYLITAIDDVPVAGLKHTDVVHLLLAGGKQRVTFNMVHLDQTSILSAPKRQPKGGHRLTSSKEADLGKLFRHTSSKLRPRMPSFLSRRRGKRDSTGAASASKEQSSTASASASAATSSAPGTSSTMPPLSPSGKITNSISKLARMIVKPRRRSSLSSMPVSPLARGPSPGSMASPTSNSPPLPRATSPLVPMHTSVTHASAQQTHTQLPLRKTLSASGVTPSPGPHRSASTLLDTTIPGPKTTSSPLLRRTLSPDQSSSPESSPTHSSGGSSGSLDSVSPLTASSWTGSGQASSLATSPSSGHKPKRALRRASTLSPSHGRPTKHERKISWQERTLQFDDL